MARIWDDFLALCGSLAHGKKNTSWRRKKKRRQSEKSFELFTQRDDRRRRAQLPLKSIKRNWDFLCSFDDRRSILFRARARRWRCWHTKCGRHSLFQYGNAKEKYANMMDLSTWRWSSSTMRISIIPQRARRVHDVIWVGNICINSSGIFNRHIRFDSSDPSHISSALFQPHKKLIGNKFKIH